MESLLPVLVTLLPMALAPFVYWIDGRNARDTFVCSVSLLTFLLALLMVPEVLDGGFLEYVLVSGDISILSISFFVDEIGLLMSVSISFLWFLAMVYSHGYMSEDEHIKRYYTFMLLSLGATMGIVTTENLFSLYIFFEVMTVTTYVFVIHEGTDEAMYAGRLYIYILLAFGVLLLFPILATYMLTDSLSIRASGLFSGESSSLHLAIFICYMLGFGAKAGLFPLHIWLPKAHPIAPSPASALLSGVLIEIGAYGMIRVVYNIFGVSMITTEMWLILAVLASINIFFGSAVAIAQKEIKTMLAYSSIAQMGYMMLGIALLTPQGLIGSAFHIFNHVFMKGCLFLCAGAIIHQTGIRNVEEFRGMGKAMPKTMLAFTIAALAMIGIPPLNGFASKWVLCMGALETESMLFIFFVFLLLLSSLMNAVYFLPPIMRAYFEEGEIKGKDPELSMILPILVLALGCIIFGIFCQPITGLIGTFVSRVIV
jgi:multicomponent Na+:H+ antiporter subunit D